MPKAIEWTDLKTQVSTLVSQASDGATVAVPSASNVDVGAGKNIVNITAIDALKIDTTAGDVDVLLNGPTDTTIENLVINGGSGRVVRLFTAKNLTIGSNNTGNVTDISPNIQLYIISSNGDVNKGVTIGKKTSKFKAVIVAPDSKVRFTNTVKLSYSGNIIANSFEAGTSTANDNFEMQYVAPSDRFYALVRD